MHQLVTVFFDFDYKWTKNVVERCAWISLNDLNFFVHVVHVCDNVANKKADLALLGTSF